jgi:cell division protein FtsL
MRHSKDLICDAGKQGQAQLLLLATITIITTITIIIFTIRTRNMIVMNEASL